MSQTVIFKLLGRQHSTLSLVLATVLGSPSSSAFGAKITNRPLLASQILSADDCEAILTPHEVARQGDRWSVILPPAPEDLDPSLLPPLSAIRPSSIPRSPFALDPTSLRIGHFLQRHSAFTGITRAQNIDFLLLTSLGDDKKILYVEFENIVLRDHNKAFQNKDVANAIDNTYREILVPAITAHKALSFRLMGAHQDYKSVRMAEGTTDTQSEQEIIGAIQQVYAQSARIFASEMLNSPFAPAFLGSRGISGNPAFWHLAGIGQTPDEATIAARMYRSFYNPELVAPTVAVFNDMQSVIADQLSKIEHLRKTLFRNLGQTALFSQASVDGKNTQILSVAAIDVLRNVPAHDLQSYIDYVRNRMLSKFNVTLSDANILHLRDYYNGANTFALGQLQAERTIIDLSHATHGLVSADFAGQGSRNILETMAALALSTGLSTSQTVKACRTAFDRATKFMDLLGSIFKTAVAEAIGPDETEFVEFSGDDGMYIPSRTLTYEEKTRILSRLAASPYASFFRITFVQTTYNDNGTAIPPENRSNLVSAAEAIEKKIRLELEGRISSQENSAFVLAVNVIPNRNGPSSVRLMTSGYYPEGVLEEIELAFERSLPLGYRAAGVHKIVPALNRLTSRPRIFQANGAIETPPYGLSVQRTPPSHSNLPRTR